MAETIGAEKAARLSDFVLRRWREGHGAITGAATPLPSPAAPAITATAPFLAPQDTRIVVNAPAYRLDVFENGQLSKTYKIGIGYPEFPLPTGLRQAAAIIFNPTWTPPDEPWVEASDQVKVGEKVPAGSRLNPLGVIKIPIGLPSLIHGGKAPAKLGSFASHGCVGMTNKQVQDFAKTLAALGGIELTGEEIRKHEKKRTETKNVKLDQPVPVELRYETIVAEDGRLRVYRDVYERGTNTEENLRAVLAAYGVTIEQLSAGERSQAKQALAQMSRNAAGTRVTNADSAEREEQKQRNIERGKLTRTVKGEKEIVIEIAALRGKGYPLPIVIEDGTKAAASENAAAPRKK
jgi:lipoprotein-anchoring transpeptidase ErfK/SrfK